MFKKILVPVTSEFCPTKAINRSAELAKLLNGEVFMMYLLVDNVMRKIDQSTEYILTSSQRKELEARMAKGLMQGAPEYLDQMSCDIEAMGVKVSKLAKQGSEVDNISSEIDKDGIDLIVMEYHSRSMFQYNTFRKSPVPIWIEKDGRPIKKVLAICSNLARNQLVPQYSAALAKIMGAKLEMLYIADKSSVQEVHPLKEAEMFLKGFEASHSDMDLSCSLVEGPLEKTAIEQIDKRSPDLTVIGRTNIKKRNNLFGIRSVKVSIGKKANSNIILLY